MRNVALSYIGGEGEEGEEGVRRLGDHFSVDQPGLGIAGTSTFICSFIVQGSVEALLCAGH